MAAVVSAVAGSVLVLELAVSIAALEASTVSTVALEALTVSIAGSVVGSIVLDRRTTVLPFDLPTTQVALSLAVSAAAAVTNLVPVD